MGRIEWTKRRRAARGFDEANDTQRPGIPGAGFLSLNQRIKKKSAERMAFVDSKQYAMGVKSASDKLELIPFQPTPPAADEVLVDVLYCG